MSVTLSEVKRAAKAHRAPLAGESAGYLVLAIADQVLSAPRLVRAAEVQLTEDGALRVLSGRASSDEDAELSLRRALDQLLLVASSGSAALTRASRRTAPVGLSALVRELEAALIPVNRAAARRALARVHRETARALQSGVLPEEEPEVASAPAAAPAPVVVAPVALQVASAPVSEPESDSDDDSQTRAIPVFVPVSHETQLDGVLSALCEELPAPPELLESDAMTIALEVRPIAMPSVATAPKLEMSFEEDVEFELEAEAVDSGEAPTVMAAFEVQPVVLAAAEAYSEQPEYDAPLEACTRPEPVVLRKSLRPDLALEVPQPLVEALPRTPTLGSLAAQLPVLDAERIAELSVVPTPLDAMPIAELADLVVCSAQDEHCTETMPEVAPLSPGVAMVASRKSDVSELLSSFQIAPDDSNQGLCRAIKEMADLDLTPAPFAALIR